MGINFIKYRGIAAERGVPVPGRRVRGPERPESRAAGHFQDG